jgi:RHS repeat-associated protein
VRIDFPEGESAYFAYDANGNLTMAHDTGAVGEVSYFAYDELNRPIQRTIQGVGTLYFAYDLAGRRTMVKDWTGAAVYYEYDRRGLISRVHSPAGWTYYTYDARGAMLTKRLPNGTTCYHEYDAAGRAASIADRKSDGSAICSFQFTRDSNGNILTSLREDDSCWYYEYDGLQRLAAADWKDGATSLYAFAYDYDKVGNRVSLVYNGTPTYYSYNAANELTVRETIGDDTLYYAYDGRGNQVKRQTLGGHTQYFAYNARDLVSRVTSTDPSFTPNYFEYNALGERVKITDSTGTTFYVWDGINITHEHDGAGNVTRRYTQGYAATEGIAQMLDVQDLTAPGDPHYWPGFDQVGGSHVVTDATGAAARRSEFSPYGRLLSETGSAPSPFMFPGTYLDLPDLPGMPLSKARIVDTWSATFLQRDTMERGRLRSPYAYGRGNPIATVDPSGLAAVRLEVRPYWTHGSVEKDPAIPTATYIAEQGDQHGKRANWWAVADHARLRAIFQQDKTSAVVKHSGRTDYLTPTLISMLDVSDTLLATMHVANICCKSGKVSLSVLTQSSFRGQPDVAGVANASFSPENPRLRPQAKLRTVATLKDPGPVRHGQTYTLALRQGDSQLVGRLDVGFAWDHSSAKKAELVVADSLLIITAHCLVDL